MEEEGGGRIIIQAKNEAIMRGVDEAKRKKKEGKRRIISASGRSDRKEVKDKQTNVQKGGITDVLNEHPYYF